VRGRAGAKGQQKQRGGCSEATARATFFTAYSHNLQTSARRFAPRRTSFRLLMWNPFVPSRVAEAVVFGVSSYLLSFKLLSVYTMNIQGGGKRVGEGGGGGTEASVVRIRANSLSCRSAPPLTSPPPQGSSVTLQQPFETLCSWLGLEVRRSEE